MVDEVSNLHHVAKRISKHPDVFVTVDGKPFDDGSTQFGDVISVFWRGKKIYEHDIFNERVLLGSIAVHRRLNLMIGYVLREIDSREHAQRHIAGMSEIDFA